MGEELLTAGTEIDALAARMLALGPVDHIRMENEGKPGAPDARLVVVPQGKTLVSLKKYLDEFAPRPDRRRATVVVRSAASLVDLTKRHRHEGNTVIFASPDRQKPVVQTVFDYHPPTDDVDDAEWGQHRAKYECELSEEWKAWTGAHGKTMEQRAFAEFVEDHVTDVIVPPVDDEKLAELTALVGGHFAMPSDLVTLSRGLQISTDIKVREAVTLSSGEISVVYEEQHRNGAGQPLQVPNMFCIAIPVFYAGPLYRIPVRLRYTTREGGIKWSLHLYRADRVFDHAFEEICSAVATQTGAPLFIGRPE